VRSSHQQPRTVQTAPCHEVIAITFRRIPEDPAPPDPEGTLDAALVLANTPEFQAAGLALYQAEAFVAHGTVW
jgi:hypothetical protein